MDERDRVLARNIAQLMSKDGRRANRGRALESDRTLQGLVADLVAARTAAGMTQQDVADRMPSTKSVVSRLESGLGTRPTLTNAVRRASALGRLRPVRG